MKLASTVLTCKLVGISRCRCPISNLHRCVCLYAPKRAGLLLQSPSVWVCGWWCLCVKEVPVYLMFPPLVRLCQLVGRLWAGLLLFDAAGSLVFYTNCSWQRLLLLFALEDSHSYLWDLVSFLPTCSGSYSLQSPPSIRVTSFSHWSARNV